MPLKSWTWLLTFHCKFLIFAVSSRRRLTLVRNGFLRQHFGTTAWLAFWWLGSTQIVFSQAAKHTVRNAYFQNGFHWLDSSGMFRDMVIHYLSLHILIEVHLRGCGSVLLSFSLFCVSPPLPCCSLYKSLDFAGSLVHFVLPSAGLTTVPSLPGRASGTDLRTFCFHLMSVGSSFYLSRILSVFPGAALVCVPVQVK